MIPRMIQAELAAYGKAFPSHFMAKFANNATIWEAEADKALARFRMDRARGLRVLDIGSGYGYFLLACRRVGHEAVGIDAPDPVIEGAARILDAEYIPHRITESDLLPTGLGMFDVATMMGVNLRGKGGWWGSTEYRRLWQAVEGHLVPGGSWIVQPNRGDGTSLLFEQDFWAVVVKNDARVIMHDGWTELQTR